MERTTEPKIVLLVRLLSAIDEGRHSFESLKERIAEGARRPSTRSLRRYLAVLADAGFPWYFDRAANAYRFAEGYSLKRLDLSNGELFGLVALRSFGASIGGAIGASIDEITDKLLGSARTAVRARVDAPSPVSFRLSETRLDEDGERAFGLFAAAERSSRSVQFIYQDKEGNRSAREADPYGFIVSLGRIYCVAYDHARRDKRVFAIDNISDVHVTAHTFTKPNDFDVEVFAAGSISGVMHGGETTLVRVRFASRVAKAALAARVVAERQTERFDDGSVEIEYRVSDVDELVRWVLGWGSQAEILTPPDARVRIASLAREIAEKYSAGAEVLDYHAGIRKVAGHVS
ncbi:MAG TPA: WYL domain-containing protein [Candidatus Baltobacteraceae bacterium]|nr:WYL domain-containing protein [Candidatus Baltobacteraceae bacterium]